MRHCGSCVCYPADMNMISISLILVVAYMLGYSCPSVWNKACNFTVESHKAGIQYKFLLGTM